MPDDVNGTYQRAVYVGRDITNLLIGIEKVPYILVFTTLLTFILVIIFGHILSKRAMLPLEEAYEKQRQFAADASHELRTPLSVVMASADLLATDESITSPFLKQVIEDVRDEVKKMAKLVSDLLTVARSDNKVVKVQLKWFDLADIISQTMRLIVPVADEKNITLKAEDLMPLKIQADEQKIRQLLMILLDNAVKYTLEGGEVVVRLFPAYGSRIKFTVTDNGIGIAPDEQEKIFDRFYRVDKARSRRMGGSGLGLPIAREIVRLHRGRISVKSELDKGTTFTVRLHTRLPRRKL